MASNNYSPYSYPYQQSSGQQYSGYQTAPASNNLSQPSRQYQSSPATSQATDYMSYQAQTYNGQGNAYGATQDNTWGSTGYGGNRETTSRAAEVLRNMSNNAYTPSSSTAVSQPGFTPTNAATTARYSSNGHSHSHQPARTQATSSTYGQTETRHQNVNANRGQASTSRGITSPAMAAGYPSQRTSASYNQSTQRSASPAQPHYNHSSQTPATSARSATMTTGTQYNDYSNRQLPHLDATRSTAATALSYNYSDSQTATITAQAPTNTVSETYNQSTITVDPMAVYDPWPEYQRKQEALRAQKAVEDAARAEEERIAEEARKEEEKKKEEERKKQEEEERARLTNTSKSKQKSRKSQQPAEATSAAAAGEAGDAPTSDAMESEIRALMAKMREFNSKDPALLARIWEEERRAKAPKSPIVAAKPAAQAGPAAQATQVTTPQAANQRKKVSAKEAPTAPVAKPAMPVASQHLARPPAPAAIAPARTGGNTIWPQEKKATLAAAAATYLNLQNPDTPIHADQILAMLNGNPSYIELCEELERMNVKLDRAAFAKNLLTAVPDVNNASKAKTMQGPGNGGVPPSAPVAPPAVMKRDIGTPATPAANYASAAPSPGYPAFPDSHTPTASTPAPVAEMVPIKPELKRPANKEEAARKRDFSDLVDLTQVDEDDFVPPPKKPNVGSTYSFGSPNFNSANYLDLDDGPTANFPISARETPQPIVHQSAAPQPVRDLRHLKIVEPLERKKALRRNTYNIKTIARDVLLACGRHPETRQLNQHLDVLRTTLPQVQQDSDLSTLRWDLIDPGEPPRGYFKDSVQGLAEDADDEDDSGDDDVGKQQPLRSSESTDHHKVKAPPLAEAINPFQQPKRRGRPPRSSFGPDSTIPSTPDRPAPKSMSASAPRGRSDGVGYSAFRSATQYDANGNPLPKKRGRPVGWRKSIHGSSQVQAQLTSSANRHSDPLKFKPYEPSTLRNANSINEPIRIESRSPSVTKAHPYQSFKCKWQNCKAELHNLDTLKQHASKVHRNSNHHGFIECHWANCATEVTNQDAMSGTRIERHEPKSFTTIANWMQHMEQRHFSPLSWELGDGPASGVSDATDSEAYLSDALGRRVTPKIIPRAEYLEDSGIDTSDYASIPKPSAAPRGRGRPPKVDQEQQARDVQKRLVAQKRRVGPGMDRGGATLVNDKRRRGFMENDDAEEELVDAET